MCAAILSISSVVAHVTVPTADMPALQTRMSILSPAAQIASKVVCTDASSLTSQPCPMLLCLGCSPLIFDAACLAASEVRSSTCTRAPARDKTVATAMPIPLAAPVTTAVLPSRLKGIALVGS